MNQRLVESVAQIVLAMSDDERRLLGRKLRYAGLQQIDEPSETEKSLRVAEMAEDMKAFEEAYGTPLSALSAEHWTLPPSAETVVDPTKEAMPSPAELAASQAEVAQRVPQRNSQRSPQGTHQGNGQQTFESFVPAEQPIARSQSQNDNGQDPSYAALYELP
ncbi:MAG: hypothetical protein AAFQ63_05445 [Cyanobacteria bacterium J06621_11]